MFLRSLLSGCVIFAAVLVLGERPFALEMRTFLILLANGVALMGISKVLWIEGIHRISVTKANALSSISPLIALMGAEFILGTAPTLWQIFSLVPIGIGIYLLGT